MELFEVRRTLPKVGDKRMETLTLGTNRGVEASPEPCTVIYVNYPHLWYCVRFERTGFRECYKLPETGPLSWEVKKR